MADYQAVPSPTNYGAPNVFQQAPQAQQQANPQQQQQQNPLAAVLQKAKDLMSRGLMSPDQYNNLAQKYGGQSAELATMGGNMGSTMPGAPGPGAPTNILPG